MTASFYIIAIVFFVLLNGFFAGSEAALTSINKIRLRHLVESKNRHAFLVDDFLKKEGLFLGTTLVGTNICAVTSSALATALLIHYFGTNAAFISTITLTAFILIFGEIVPKTIFRRAADVISLKIITPLRFSFRLLYPLIFVTTRIANFILRPFFKHRASEKTMPFLTKSDFKHILRISKEKGGVEADEEKLIYRVFEFGTITAGKIMIPSYQVVSVDVNESVEALKKLLNEKRYSRIPVYENDKNNIIGTINIYDILFAEEGEKKESLRDYVQSPYFINDDEGLDSVLTNLRKKKKPMAVVINKEKKCVGILTIEDILEEIVGEIGG